MVKKVTKVVAMLFFALLLMPSARAQELFFDGGISTDFDNTEYDGSEVGTSGTIFVTELTVSLGYRWNDRHSIVAGAELMKDFGSNRFIDYANLIAYYRFRNDDYGAFAGIFKRDELVGRYSRAFYDDAYLIYNSLVQGIALQYTGAAFAELAVDWTGLYSDYAREHFRVLASAGGDFGHCFNAGVSFSLQHFANKSTFHGNVVDNVLINPYAGARFSAVLDFEFRIGLLQSLQRDRRSDEGWTAPLGGELYVRMGWKGIFVDNNLYVGRNLTPFWHRTGNDGEPYGDNLYTCDPFYGTDHKVYNRTGIGYERRFWDDNLAVRAEMVLKCNGSKLVCQQLVGVAARICPTIYEKKKHTKQ